MRAIPEKPTLDGLEAKWRAHWAEHGTYRFDRTKTLAEVFSIDTPATAELVDALHEAGFDDVRFVELG